MPPQFQRSRDMDQAGWHSESQRNIMVFLVDGKFVFSFVDC
jgi:hypothetical protein